MLLFLICAVISLIFLAGGFLVWLVLSVLKIRPKGGRIFKRTLLVLAVFLPFFIFLALPLIFSYHLTHSSTRTRDRELASTPASYGCPFAVVQFPSRDGLMLQGWWMEGEEGKPILLLCHGLFRSRQEVLERACSLNKLGYPAFLFDFRGHGKSQQELVSLGFRERLDVLGAYDFLKKGKRPKFALLGVSMGAVAVLHAANEFGSDLATLIADSPFLSLEETVSHHTHLLLGLPSFPFADLFVWNLTRINGYREADLNTAKALEGIKEIPILLIYGREDRRISPATAQAIFDAIPHARKKIIFFEGATHGAAYRSDSEKYLEIIKRFLQRSPPPG